MIGWLKEGVFYLNKKWKIIMTILVIVFVASLSSIYIFVLQGSQPRSSQPQSNAYTSFYGEIDATTVVSQVIDGDTFDTTSEGRIRLADVDAPETGESGYYDAKSFLIGLVNEKTVYLDIDDVYRTDKYDRLVCVVYVNYNSTHFKNVNKALLVVGYAIIKDYSNEFSPHGWSLYCPKEGSSPPEEEPLPSSPPSQKFVGSRKSDVYHYPSCYWAKKIKPENKISFSSSKDAKAHGYRPCKVCKPP